MARLGTTSGTLITAAIEIAYQICWLGLTEAQAQGCSVCGVNDGAKPLHVRAWRCGGCGAWLDRDINAAVKVAKAAGLAVTACGAQVRPDLVPAQRGEAGTYPKSCWKTA